MPTYAAKRLQMEAESAFELTADRLTRSVGGAPHQQLALAEVSRVRISYMPPDIVQCWICTVTTPRGSVWIPSATYPAVGQAQDQRGAFRPFVQALTIAIADQTAGRPVVFERGGGRTRLVYLLLAIAAGVMTASAALMSFPFGLLLATPFGALAWMFWRFWRRAPPTVFDPRALPADIAP